MLRQRESKWLKSFAHECVYIGKVIPKSNNVNHLAPNLALSRLAHLSARSNSLNLWLQIGLSSTSSEHECSGNRHADLAELAYILVLFGTLAADGVYTSNLERRSICLTLQSHGPPQTHVTIHALALPRALPPSSGLKTRSPPDAGIQSVVGCRARLEAISITRCSVLRATDRASHSAVPSRRVGDSQGCGHGFFVRCRAVAHCLFMGAARMPSDRPCHWCEARRLSGAYVEA